MYTQIQGMLREMYDKPFLLAYLVISSAVLKEISITLIL